MNASEPTSKSPLRYEVDLNPDGTSQVVVDGQVVGASSAGREGSDHRAVEVVVDLRDSQVDPIRADIHEIARVLVSHLGPTLVAAAAGARDRKLPHAWARADGPAPCYESEVRLRTTMQAWNVVDASDGAEVARAWFIGSNPRLSEHGSPVMALREGRYAEVMGAARAFTTDSQAP